MMSTVFLLMLLKVWNFNFDPVVDMLLYKTDFSSESVVGISCEEFPGPFFIRTDSLHITDGVVKSIILKELSQSRKMTEFSMDTRDKLYMYHRSGKTDTLCFQESKWFLFNGQSLELQSYRLIKLFEVQKGWNVDNGRIKTRNADKAGANHEK